MLGFLERQVNLLLRCVPAPPAKRRLFFSAVMACRRRLGKRWETTPLAKVSRDDVVRNKDLVSVQLRVTVPRRSPKLFTMEDEWAMLRQRAQASRIRDAIAARGLMLHDAFIKFDYDKNGRLSLGEVGNDGVARTDLLSLHNDESPSFAARRDLRRAR